MLILGCSWLVAMTSGRASHRATLANVPSRSRNHKVYCTCFMQHCLQEYATLDDQPKVKKGRKIKAQPAAGEKKPGKRLRKTVSKGKAGVKKGGQKKGGGKKAKGK